jgi:hypothetical protein
MDYLDQFLGGIHLTRPGFAVWRYQIFPHVFFQNFGHQSIDRATRCGNPLKKVRAAGFTVQRTLDRIDLPA